MIYKLLISTLLASAVSCFTELEYKTSFSDWMQQYNKSYTSVDFAHRYNAFKTTMDKVEACNTNPKFTFRCGLNKFSDLPHEEFLSLYTGFKRVNQTANHTQRPFVALNPTPIGLSSGDDTVNWNDKGAVTPVKDQGQCGSCWSFSTTGVVEGAVQISSGNLVSLSEQNLMDCSSDYGNAGCSGGDPGQALQYIIANGGIDTESSYPYTAQNGNCQFSQSNIGSTISNYKSLNSGDENDLVNNLNNQPVSVSVDATDNMQNYQSGIFNDDSCGNDSGSLDHSILAVGYGDGYYVVKNSWGADWGMQGYIMMSRDADNQCGIATEPYIAVA